MRRLVYRLQANRDLTDIADGLVDAGASLEAAERFASRLRAKCRDLAANPATLGTGRPEFEHGLRSFPYRRYLIFFRYRDDDALEVARVVHGARDLPRLFEAEEG